MTSMKTPYKTTAISESDYDYNLWLAIEDIWTEMYVSDMTPQEIKAHLVNTMKIYCDEMKKYAHKDLHGMSAHKRRKLR